MVKQAQHDGFCAGRRSAPGRRGDGVDAQSVLLHPAQRRPRPATDDVDDDACITTLANVFYRTIYYEGTSPYEDTWRQDTRRDREFIGVGLPHRTPRRFGRPSVPGRLLPGRRPQAEGGDDRHALSDRLLRALSRRLHGDPGHRLPRLEHPLPRKREQLPARPRPGRHRRRRPLAARGAARGNHRAAWQFRRRLADGRLPGAGRRPARHAAGRHATRQRASANCPRPTATSPAPRTPAGPRCSRRGWTAPWSTRTIPSPPTPAWTSSTSATARRTRPTSSSATAPRRSPATTRSPTGSTTS